MSVRERDERHQICDDIKELKKKEWRMGLWFGETQKYERQTWEGYGEGFQLEHIIFEMLITYYSLDVKLAVGGMSEVQG